MNLRFDPPANRRFPGPWVPAVLALGLFGACMNTLQKREGPTDEQLIELYTTTATFLYEDESLVRAQDQAVKALELDPENRAMRRMIGWIRLRMGTPEDLIIAEQFFRDLTREGDDNQATKLGLATALERMGTAYDSSSQKLADGESEPTEADPELEVLRMRGLAEDFWAESATLYEGVLGSGEGSTNAMNGLQRVYALSGHFDKSLEWSQRLLERSDEELVIWRRMLTQTDLTEKEDGLFRENERIAKQLQRDTHLFAATVLYRLERYQEALEHIDALVDLDPGLPQAYSLRAQLEARAGLYEPAIEDLDRFLTLSDKPFEHADIRRAFDLRAEYEKALRQEDE